MSRLGGELLWLNKLFSLFSNGSRAVEERREEAKKALEDPLNINDRKAGMEQKEEIEFFLHPNFLNVQ